MGRMGGRVMKIGMKVFDENLREVTRLAFIGYDGRSEFWEGIWLNIYVTEILSEVRRLEWW
jgi:hypothetical protein